MTLRQNRYNDFLPTRQQFMFPFETLVNKFFDDFFADANTPAMVKSKTGYPRMDIYTQDGKWTMEIGCPGLTEKDISVNITPNADGSRYISISGRQQREHENADFHIKELSRSAFERILRLPDSIKGDPEAVLKNGVLTLSWTAPPPTHDESHSIPIKSIEG